MSDDRMIAVPAKLLRDLVRLGQTSDPYWRHGTIWAVCALMDAQVLLDAHDGATSRYRED